MFEHGLILQTEGELFRLWLQCTASAVATLHAQVWSLFTPERLWAHLCSGCVCLLSCPALPNPTSTELFGENCYWSDLLCIISSASTFSDIVSCRILGEIQDWKCFSDPSFWEEVGTWVFGELEAGRGETAISMTFGNSDMAMSYIVLTWQAQIRLKSCTNSFGKDSRQCIFGEWNVFLLFPF